MNIQALSDVLGSEIVNPLGCALYELFAKEDEQEDVWHVQRSTEPAKMWLNFRCKDAHIAQQGWKLHISANTASAIAVLHLVLPILFKERPPFKLVVSLQALATLNCGEYGWSQIGKFLTIYPDSDREAVRLATILDQATAGLSAPRVPSDRPLHAGSLVHYRYGEFRGELYIQERSGLVEPALRTPTNELVPDRRKNHYEMPAWCLDPFRAAGITSDGPGVSHIIGGRYLAVRIVAASPAHTISLAVDLISARPCILKAPGLAWRHGACDSIVNQNLRREAAILRQLAPLPQIPALYDCVEQDRDTVLVMEDIQGETLTDYMASLVSKGQYMSLLQTVKFGKKLAALLKKIHTHGLVYADLKSSNIIIDGNGEPHLIDFELTGEPGQPSNGQCGTRGYLSPQRQRGLPLAVADDIYSFGSLLYFLVTAAEPSDAPRPHMLLQRLPAWFSPAGTRLQGIIERCLHELAEERYASMDEVEAVLDAVDTWQAPSLSSHELQGHAPAQDVAGGRKKHYRELARTLFATICTVAQRATGRRGLCWISTHRLTYGLIMRDVNTGNAGTVLALAELVAAYPEAQQRPFLAEAADSLSRAPFINGQPLPGLYIGEAGVGAALLRAGQILSDEKLIVAAVERGRLVASLPYESPDLFNGTAGRLRFHLLLWDETREQEHLRAAIVCGEEILRTIVMKEELECYWTIPEGYRGMSGRAYLGYAHGAAGIADSLLDLFDVTGDERYIAPVLGVARWLKRQAIVVPDDEQALNWPKGENEPATTPFWCHGGAGIGKFFLHIAQQHLFPGANEITACAARSVARGTRWAGPTQCHGLAGNIEFLLDMYQSTGRQEYHADALMLARCLDAFALEQEGLLVFPSEAPTTFTPDYMVGYAGIALCLLRLSAPEHMPHQLSRCGFRYKSLVDEVTSEGTQKQKEVDHASTATTR